MGDLSRYAGANARMRALLPSLLSRGELEALYSHPTTEALRGALLPTPYGPALAKSAHAETALSARLVEVGRIALRLLSGPGNAFIRTYLLRHELENLKILVRAIHRSLPWAVIAPHIVPMPGIGTIDPKALASAHDLRALAERLARTAYELPLRHALHRVEAVGPFAVEIALELDYYDRLWAAAAALPAADAEHARRLLGTLFDILNLAWIARYRDGLGLSPEEILNYTLRSGRWLTVGLRRRLAEDPRQPWDAALAGTPYGPLLAEAPTAGFEAAHAALWRYLAGEIRRELTGYPFHIGVPLGFLMAQEIEIRDLRILLAAKRFGVSAGETLGRLAGTRH